MWNCLIHLWVDSCCMMRIAIQVGEASDFSRTCVAYLSSDHNKLSSVFAKYERAFWNLKSHVLVLVRIVEAVFARSWELFTWGRDLATCSDAIIIIRKLEGWPLLILRSYCSNFSSSTGTIFPCLSVSCQNLGQYATVKEVSKNKSNKHNWRQNISKPCSVIFLDWPQ